MQVILGHVSFKFFRLYIPHIHFYFHQKHYSINFKIKKLLKTYFFSPLKFAEVVLSTSGTRGGFCYSYLATSPFMTVGSM